MVHAPVNANKKFKYCFQKKIATEIYAVDSNGSANQGLGLL
jgi:hypothetical protein